MYLGKADVNTKKAQPGIPDYERPGWLRFFDRDRA